MKSHGNQTASCRRAPSSLQRPHGASGRIHLLSFPPPCPSDGGRAVFYGDGQRQCPEIQGQSHQAASVHHRRRTRKGRPAAGRFPGGHGADGSEPFPGTLRPDRHQYGMSCAQCIQKR